MSYPMIPAGWAAPPNVHAFCTTRAGGVSVGPWASFNLGLRCDDDPASVDENRGILGEGLPAAPRWLHQVHGTDVVRHDGDSDREAEGDALVAFRPGRVCAVLTADCLPVFFCNRHGDRAGVAHAGWRGLARGVLKATVAALEEDPDQLMAWFGPAIGPAAYEVGDEVRDEFSPEGRRCFRRHGSRWLMDIYALARLNLDDLGVAAVSGGGYCTLSEPERFFSYRRDGVTGRMASLIWLDPAD